jgi:hypothetical protein
MTDQVLRSLFTRHSPDDLPIRSQSDPSGWLTRQAGGIHNSSYRRIVGETFGIVYNLIPGEAAEPTYCTSTKRQMLLLATRWWWVQPDRHRAKPAPVRIG